MKHGSRERPKVIKLNMERKASDLLAGEEKATDWQLAEDGLKTTIVRNKPVGDIGSYFMITNETGKTNPATFRIDAHITIKEIDKDRVVLETLSSKGKSTKEFSKGEFINRMAEMEGLTVAAISREMNSRRAALQKAMSLQSSRE